MSEVNRPSANEQARADAQRAAEKKAKYKTPQTKVQQQAAQQGKPKGTEKNLKSAFDNVLDNMVEGQGVPLMPSEATKFDSKLKEIQHDDDRRGDKDKGEEEDHKTKNKGEGRSSDRTAATGIKGKVSAKHGLKDQGQGGSSGERQQGQKGGEAAARQNIFEGTQSGQMRQQPVVAPPPAYAVAQAQNVQAAEAAAAPRELPKAVLDQIIQSVTIMRNKELDKEIQIDFQDNFFNGLKLKVTAKGDEVSVEFIVPNRDVYATFKDEREKIAAALGDKGIDIRSIEVTQR